MELKTLKDVKLEECSEGCMSAKEGCDAEFYDKTRTEIFKIIKFMDNHEFNEVCAKFGFKLANELVGARKMLMWLANLSEDDLK